MRGKWAVVRAVPVRTLGVRTPPERLTRMARERTAVAAPNRGDAGSGRGAPRGDRRCPARSATRAAAPRVTGSWFGRPAAPRAPGPQRAIAEHLATGGPAPSSHLQRGHARCSSGSATPTSARPRRSPKRIAAAGPVRAKPAGGRRGCGARRAAADRPGRREDERGRREPPRAGRPAPAPARVASSPGGSAPAGASAGGTAEQRPARPGRWHRPRLGERAHRLPGPGSAMDPTVSATIGSALGVDLSTVRVHTDAKAQAAAAALGARAFTVGQDISLAAGESTHRPAADGARGDPRRPAAGGEGLPRGGARGRRAPASDSLIPDFILDAVKSFARNFPGYSLMTVVAGYDPIAGETGPDAGEPRRGRDRAGAVRQRAGRAAARFRTGATDLRRDRGGVGPAQPHPRTRLKEISTAWSELEVAKRIDGNIAVIERHIKAVTTDVSRSPCRWWTRDGRDQAAAVGLAEKAVQTPRSSRPGRWPRRSSTRTRCAAPT